ncbi:FKBP-type peptidyl-prolyl cis-trans isomerase [Candidatus Methylospira mobilis]|uniref:Peptidyl-prolyl cis-trans isomerase n=1 Tax=Candidatus Methylospira mobilis TaxID=1808979 RepID=A0A5Q0BPY4_9GAMM|nr:FKBP-type peptidyl-prolyl cis-trans isomerase [Candidatus Methylospira mobilis]QFY44148.1 FKBP-type peptidyl-prolyl cis-trans isomerase [Candidatus Methylospira mobilis]
MLINRLFQLYIATVLIMTTNACSAPDSKQDPKQTLVQGEAFLTDNAAKPGVVKTPSGLQYQVISEGTGKKPAASDSVTVNYTGSLISGTVFDEGKGITFPLNAVISGWTEGVQLMSEGSRYRFFIPSALAYGEHGAGRVIPPNAALIFDIDLIKVNR